MEHGGSRQLWCLNRMVFGVVRRTRDQVWRRTRQEHRQGALQMRRRVNAQKDGPRNGEGVELHIMWSQHR